MLQLPFSSLRLLAMVALGPGLGTCDNGGASRKLTPCPKGCRCVKKIQEFGDCRATVSCERLSAFPKASEYPAGLDCVFFSGAALGKQSDEQKETGLRALPTSIRRLDLSGCGLRNLPTGDALGRLSELRVLNLEFNRLESLPVDAFHGLSKLKVLWLTGNHIEKGEEDYERMKKLGNRLKALDEAQFQGLTALQVLLLHHNRLATLPKGIFRDQKKLRVLKLLDNRFKPPLTKKHEAFAPLLEPSDGARAVYQLDIRDDSGDDLEDYWEATGTYLSDDFSPGRPPRKTQRRSKDDEF